MVNFDPYRIETPEPIVTKCGTIDYVRDEPRKRNLVQIHPLAASGLTVTGCPVENYIVSTVYSA